MKKTLQITFGIILAFLLMGTACGALVSSSSEKSHKQLDQYYTHAQSCDIESPTYLNCLNDAAYNDLGH